MRKYGFLLLATMVICGYAADENNGKEESPKPAFSIQLFCPQPELLYKQDGKFPFAYFWRKDFIDIRRFEKVLLKPLNVEKFDFREEDKINPAFQEELAQLSGMLAQEFGRAVDIEGKRMELKSTGQADDKTMIVEVALVPLVPLDSYRRLASYHGGKPGTSEMVSDMLNRNLLAIEVVVRSGEDGELVAQMAALCGDPKESDAAEKKPWTVIARKQLADWSLKFVSTIKAELNRDKNGRYQLISGKIQPSPESAKDKEKK